MRAIFVTGLGVVCPAGLGTDALWRAWCERADLFTPIAPVYPGMREDCIAARIPETDRVRLKRDLEGLPEGLPDSSAFAVHAALQAIRDAGLAPGDAALRDALVCFGNNEAQADLLDEFVDGKKERWRRHIYSSHSIADDVALAVGSRGPAYTIHNTCASGNVALEVALRMLSTGAVSTAIIGGGDAFSKKVWSGFHALNALGPERCRPFSTLRRYITIAEGGASLVLRAHDGGPRPSGAYAQLVAAVTNNDARHPTNPDIGGVADCHAKLLRQAGITAAQIDAILAHGTGTKANDAVEAGIFSRDYRGAAVTAMKGTTGHMMATAGSIGAVGACLALRQQILPPTRTDPSEFEFDFDLVMHPRAPDRPLRYVQNNAFGFGGDNAITLFRSISSST